MYRRLKKMENGKPVISGQFQKESNETKRALMRALPHGGQDELLASMLAPSVELAGNG